MVTNIQPFQFIRRTNIKEHNALGDKINEIITVVNDLNLDNVGTEIEQLQTEVSELNTNVSGNTADITDLKSKVQQNTTDIAENTEMVQGLSSELPTSFALTLENDILTYRYNKEDGTFLDSNPVTMPYMTGDDATAQFQPKGNYETVTGAESKYQPKGDYETVSGAAGKYQPKGNYETVTGAEAKYQPKGDYETVRGAASKYQPIGDYLTEVPIGGDVIGGIKNGGNVVINPDGTANASGQGTGIDSNVLTYANNKLKSTINGVDSNEVEITGGTVDAYTKAESDAKYATKSEIPDVSNFVTQVELAGDLADYMTADDVAAQYQVKGDYETVSGAASKYQPIGNYETVENANATFQPKGDYETVSGAADKYQPIGDYLTEVPIGGSTIGGVKNGGNVTIESDGTMNATGSGGGGGWEKLDLSNLPTDFKDGDILLAFFKIYMSSIATAWDAPITQTLKFMIDDAESHAVIFKIRDIDTYVNAILYQSASAYEIKDIIIDTCYNTEVWNTNSGASTLMKLNGRNFNGASNRSINRLINRDNIADNISEMYRMRI